MRPRSFGPLLGVLIALMMTGTNVIAQAVPYNHELRMKQEAMHRLYVRTRYCMYTASKAMLYQGVNDRAAILVFTTSSCAGGLRSYLVNQMSWTPADVSRLIVAVANLELDAASSSI